MKNYFNLFLLLVLLAFSCKTPSENTEEQTVQPKASVEVTSIQYGSVEDELDLLGTTIYLKRNLVTAPIPSYITRVFVKLGDKVKEGQTIYELESKERRALGNNAGKLDSSFANFGIIKVKASATGIISTLDKQQPGDYVLEGSQLCTIAESNDLAFQINVPFEYSEFTRTGKKCKIILPDNTSHNATITTPLSAMNALAQTQIVLAKPSEVLFLPENMIVQVSVNKGKNEEKQILPKACVLSDEMLKEFWVMKMTNDSIAIKVPVTTGNKNQEEVEILSPQFSPSDKILSNGNYGLPDTALVSINQ